MRHCVTRELLALGARQERDALPAPWTLLPNATLPATGFARSGSPRVLVCPLQVPAPIRRPRAPRSSADVQVAVEVGGVGHQWQCARRLVPFRPDPLQALERHGQWVRTPGMRGRRLRLIPATAGRLLRRVHQPPGLSTTRPGRLPTQQVPVRTFADGKNVLPEFFAADLLRHGGGYTEGAFLSTLTLSDRATAWTTCLPLRLRVQHAVVESLDGARSRLPFPLLGLDMDNGGGFINAELFARCNREQVTFTRGCTANKNAPCFIEQETGSVVRTLAEPSRSLQLDGHVLQFTLKPTRGSRKPVGPRALRTQVDPVCGRVG